MRCGSMDFSCQMNSAKMRMRQMKQSRPRVLRLAGCPPSTNTGPWGHGYPFSIIIRLEGNGLSQGMPPLESQLFSA